MEKSEYIQYYNDHILGHNWVLKFEEEMAKYLNVKYVVAVASGTAAIQVALSALDFKFGDEIIVPNLTVMMTVTPIMTLGLTPVFVDMDKDKIDFDYEDAESKISKNTKAILPVYLWGHAYNMEKLKKFASRYNLKVIEDACQAQGTKYNGRMLGTFGDVGCFSLKEGKIISSDEGGYLATNNDDIAKSARLLRNHYIDSENPKASFRKTGYNYRLPAHSAFIALDSLNKVGESIEKRKTLCNLLQENINLEFYRSDNCEQWNYFSPIAFIKSKNAASMLASDGVPNSVGSFGLIAASKRRSVIDYLSDKNIINKTTNVDNFLDKAIAICLTNNYNKDDGIKMINILRSWD